MSVGVAMKIHQEIRGAQTHLFLAHQLRDVIKQKMNATRIVAIAGASTKGHLVGIVVAHHRHLVL